MTGFLLQVCLLEAIWGGFGATAYVQNDNDVHKVVSRLRPISVGSWRWPANLSRFYGNENVIAMVCPWEGTPSGGEGHDLMIGARSRQAIAFLKEILPESWDELEGGVFG